MAYLEAAIPELVQHLPNQFRHHRRGFLPIQKHEVNIGVRSQFAPAIPTQRHKATVLETGLHRALVHPPHDVPVPADNEPINQLGQGSHDLRAGGAVP